MHQLETQQTFAEIVEHFGRTEPADTVDTALYLGYS